jgi:hypothetical protein
VLFVPVVVDVPNVSVVDGDELEDEQIASASILSGPVDADDERALSGFDELVSSESGVAGPLGRRFLLLLEDRPGLFRPLSARRPPPPEEAVFDAAPDGVGPEERSQRLGIALVEGGIGCLDSLDAC